MTKEGNGKITWKTARRKISELIPSVYNPRQATKKQKKDLTASLEKFDIAAPLVINTNNHIIISQQQYHHYYHHHYYWHHHHQK